MTMNGVCKGYEVLGQVYTEAQAKRKFKVSGIKAGIEEGRFKEVEVIRINSKLFDNYEKIKETVERWVLAEMKKTDDYNTIVMVTLYRLTGYYNGGIELEVALDLAHEAICSTFHHNADEITTDEEEYIEHDIVEETEGEYTDGYNLNLDNCRAGAQKGKIWFALQEFHDDPWDNGTSDLTEALEMLHDEDYIQIAVIDQTTVNPVCIGVIYYDEHGLQTITCSGL